MSHIFQVTKIVQNICNMPWFCASMFVYQSILVKLFLYIFLDFYGNLSEPKWLSFISLNSFLTWLQPVDRAGRLTCTDVHASSGRRAGRPTRSTVQRALLSGKAPGGRPDRDLLSVSLPRSAGRSTDGTTVWNMTVGRSAGRSTGRPDRTLTASFSSPINLGVWALFFNKIFGDFWASFSYFIKRVFLH